MMLNNHDDHKTEQLSSASKPNPVAIGGVGGSGTRLVANLLQNLDFFIGSDLNPAKDNLSFTLLFKRLELWPIENNSSELEKAWRIFFKAMEQQAGWTLDEQAYLKSLIPLARPNHNKSWVETRVDHILNPAKPEKPPVSHWGWKEPNTHIVLPAILKYCDNLKYIHVIRHGLDTAFSDNQNQLPIWGPQILGHTIENLTPQVAFQYWCAVHRRIINIGNTMGERFLLLNYDRLCTDPDSEIPVLLNFLGIPVDHQVNAQLQKLIEKPKSIGRYKQYNIDFLTLEGRDFLTEMGFSIT